MEELPLLTDRCIAHQTAGLARLCRSLQHLSLSRCRGLTFASLLCLSRYGVELRVLDMTLIAGVEEAEKASAGSERGREWRAAKARLDSRGCQLLRGYHAGQGML